MINLLSHAFFPEVCLVCERLLYEKEKYICLYCLHRLPRTGFLSKRENPLFLNLVNRIPVRSAQALFYFHKNNNSQKIVHGIKYTPLAFQACWFGRLMGKEWLRDSLWKPDVVVPVPLHPKRKKERGYNQSEELAKGYIAETGAELNSDALLRTTYKSSQTQKGKMQRWEDVQEVYEKNQSVDLKGKTVLLIDDVITTGATLEACGKVLLSMGIRELHVYSLSLAVL